MMNSNLDMFSVELRQLEGHTLNCCFVSLPPQANSNSKIQSSALKDNSRATSVKEKAS